MFDCAEARNLVSRSDEVSFAQPFKAGITCEIQDLRRVSDEGIFLARSSHG